MRPRSLSRALVLAATLLAAAAALRAEPGSVLDDPAFVHELDRGLSEVYAFRLDQASATLARLGARRPGHPAEPLLQAVPLWWEVMADPADPSRDERLLALIEATLDRSAARLDEDRHDLDARFMRATALALRGRLASLRGEWIAAAWDGKRALGLVRDLAHDQPGNLDLLFGLGLYDYFAAVVPERYAVFRPLKPFFPAGDRDRGLARLERVAREGHFARVEADWFLLIIGYHFEPDPVGALARVRRLRSRYPDNPLFHVYEGRILARWGDCRSADAVLSAALARHDAGRRGYTDAQAEHALYALVTCDLRLGRPRQALDRLDRLEALAARRGSSYLALARLRRGMVLDLDGRRAAAIASYRDTLAAPDAGRAHEHARRYLREAYGKR